MCYILFLIVVAAFGGSSIQAQTVVQEDELSRFKRDSRTFEQIISELIKEDFDNPFALAAEPRAAYLRGHGVVVSFQLRINRSSIKGLYGEIFTSKKSRSMEEEIKVIKSTIVEALADYAGTIKGVGSDEKISVCAHIEDRNELDAAKSRVDLVMSVLKSDVDLYVTKKITVEQFRKRILLFQY
jgi:hypothetical protein